MCKGVTMEIKINSKSGLYEVWSENKLLISSDNLKGIVFSKKEIEMLFNGYQITIEDEERIYNVLKWIMFL